MNYHENTQNQMNTINQEIRDNKRRTNEAKIDLYRILGELDIQEIVEVIKESVSADDVQKIAQGLTRNFIVTRK